MAGHQLRRRQLLCLGAPLNTMIEAARLHTVSLPIRAPFTTSFSTQTVRTMLLVELEATVDGHSVVGWGECVALPDPVYSEEYLRGARAVIADYLVPALVAAQQQRPVTAETTAHELRHFVGHRMAKAAVEMAILDAELRVANRSLGSYLGAVVERVPSGVSVGIMDTIPELLRAVGGYLEEGYCRIKLKIKPGWDLEPIGAVRREFGDIPLQVDANAAYSLQDSAHLRRLDEHGLLLVEQPLAEDDLRQHAVLARRMGTPICLDESVVSGNSAADAISLGAAEVINIKPGRVGGYLEARRIHDLSRAHGVAVWCGGMLESGLGRTANTALAALPGFTLPGDISGSDRFYLEDLTEPIVMRDGFVSVSNAPGVGPLPRHEILVKRRQDLTDIELA